MREVKTISGGVDEAGRKTLREAVGVEDRTRWSVDTRAKDRASEQSYA